MPAMAARKQPPLTIMKALDPQRPARPSPLGNSVIPTLPIDMVEKLRSWPLFADAPPEFLVEVAAFLKPRTLVPQESLLHAGDIAKAMFWIIRGEVVVTSKDKESIYAVLGPGSFVGEIGILMNVPRTASVVARYKTLCVRLGKEDLHKILPKYPSVDRALREEAQERLAILDRQREEREQQQAELARTASKSKRPRDEADRHGSLKRLKHGSNPLSAPSSSTLLDTGSVYVRDLLSELPLFKQLPGHLLHYLGLSAMPKSYPPFTKIIEESAMGKEIYFITSGEVEVFREANRDGDVSPSKTSKPHLKARLTKGSFFGEVASLSLSPRRTATVRSVTEVQCLVIPDSALDGLWEACSPVIRQELETVARERLRELREAEHEAETGEAGPKVVNELAVAMSSQHITPAVNGGAPPIVRRSSASTIPKPLNPDPFNVGHVGSTEGSLLYRRRKRSFNAPSNASPLALSPRRRVSLVSNTSSATPTSIPSTPTMRRPTLVHRPASNAGRGRIPDAVLIQVFKYLDVVDLLKLRGVSIHWARILSSSPDIMTRMDLSRYGRKITDAVMIQSVLPFVRDRPREVDLSTCFHLTDEGFTALIATCGRNLISLRMKSVWEVGAAAIMELAHVSSRLERLDVSNCRKLNDSILARIVGWYRPEDHLVNGAQRPFGQHLQIGCQNLRSINLSYCKQVTNKSMAILARLAAPRLEELTLTRCTTISDEGFQLFRRVPFPRLRKLCLRDCTYLTDISMQCLAAIAPSLEHLDISFCCALSDRAIEIISLGCTRLNSLDVAYCGSAVSDDTLSCVGARLRLLRRLSIRGCIRATGIGVEAILRGCPRMEELDVSSCLNVRPWLNVNERRFRGARVKINTVADGTWRVGA